MIREEIRAIYVLRGRMKTITFCTALWNNYVTIRFVFALNLFCSLTNITTFSSLDLFFVEKECFSFLSSTFFPLKVEFSWYISFKVGTFLKEKRNEIRLTRVFNYGSHRIYDFRERIRTRNDDSATLNPLILLH